MFRLAFLVVPINSILGYIIKLDSPRTVMMIDGYKVKAFKGNFVQLFNNKTLSTVMVSYLSLPYLIILQ